jgi:hypothetical protein
LKGKPAEDPSAPERPKQMRDIRFRNSIVRLGMLPGQA